MSDELARLEAALRTTSPRPPAAARERAVSEALAAFDRYRREAGDENRPGGRVPKRGASWRRRLAMSLSRPSLAVAGSVAVVALAGIVSHRVLVTPSAPPSRTPALAIEGAPPAVREHVAAAAPEAARGEPPVAVAEPEPADSPPAPQAGAAPGTSVRGSTDSPRPPRATPTPGAPAPRAPAPDRAAEVLAEAYLSGHGLAEPAARRSAEAGARRTEEALLESRRSSPGGPGTTVPKSLETIAHDGLPPRFSTPGRDGFADFAPNPVQVVAEAPVSTFSIDVDTASYSFIRAALDAGRLPEKDAVRTEELVNHFPYDYAPPETRDPPFATHATVIPAPWNDSARLLHIGIQGYLPAAASTPVAIAKDVKAQVEFNPAFVSEYRLIGYETRMVAREDFRNDKVGAGEIGAGHTATALYELTPAGTDAGRTTPLRYRRDGAEPGTDFGGEIAFLKIRYKLPGADTSNLLTRPVTTADAFETVDAAPRDARFAAAVAAFGELLRGGRYTGDYGYGDIVALARGARGRDPFGYRDEFVRLVRAGGVARDPGELNEPVRTPRLAGNGRSPEAAGTHDPVQRSPETSGEFPGDMLRDRHGRLWTVSVRGGRSIVDSLEA